MAVVSSGEGCKGSSNGHLPPPAGTGGAGALGGGNGGGGDAGGGYAGGGGSASGEGGAAGAISASGGGGGAATGGAGGGSGDCYQSPSRGSLGGSGYPLCGGWAGATGTAGPPTYTLTPGTNCFQVTGPYCLDDGCGATYDVASEIAATYDAAAGTITIPSLGTGPLVLNGDRANGTTSGRAGFGTEGPQGCTYLSTIDAAVLLTGNDSFALSHRWTRDSYDEICHTKYHCVEPAAGSCTSSWTITLTLDPTNAFQSGGCQ